MPTYFQPSHDGILIKRDTAANVSDAGIVIPLQAQEQPRTGIVVAIGQGKIEGGVLLPMPCERGNRVLFAEYAGTEIKLDGNEFLLLLSTDVLGIFTEQEEPPSAPAPQIKEN